MAEERRAALADSAEQRRVTGGARGYRPAGLSPWEWDDGLPPECIRWSFSHTRELTLTAQVSRHRNDSGGGGGGGGGDHCAATAANDGPSALPRAARQLDLPSLTFTVPPPPASTWDAPAGEVAGLPAGSTRSVEEMLAATHTDCFLVLHRGALVHESYRHGCGPRTKRLGMSMGKTLTGLVVGALAARGLLRLGAPLAEYVPELAGGGYAGATVQQALDMRVAVDYDEMPWLAQGGGGGEDAGEEAGEGEEEEEEEEEEATVVYQHMLALGSYPRTARARRERWPRTNYAFLLSQQREGGGDGDGDGDDMRNSAAAAAADGGPRWQYQSCVAEALGLLAERVSGERLPALLSELVWAPMGAEEDADMQLDSVGAAVACGGLCATARDWARVGLLLQRDGAVVRGGGVAGAAAGATTTTQVLPAAFVRGCRTAPAAQQEAFGRACGAGTLEGDWGMGYHNQLWLFGCGGAGGGGGGGDGGGDGGAGSGTCAMKGVNGQAVMVDAAREIVCVKLSSQPTYVDDAMDDAFMAAYEAIVRELTGEEGYSLRG